MCANVWEWYRFMCANSGVLRCVWENKKPQLRGFLQCNAVYYVVLRFNGMVPRKGFNTLGKTTKCGILCVITGRISYAENQANAAHQPYPSALS